MAHWEQGSFGCCADATLRIHPGAKLAVAGHCDEPKTTRGAPNFMGVRHIGLMAKDPASLRVFYRDVISMKIVRQTLLLIGAMARSRSSLANPVCERLANTRVAHDMRPCAAGQGNARAAQATPIGRSGSTSSPSRSGTDAYTRATKSKRRFCGLTPIPLICELRAEEIVRYVRDRRSVA
jgi:hypothetical protein